MISINYPVLFFIVAIVIASIAGVIYLIRNNKLRRKDYVIIYTINIIIYSINLMSPVKMSSVFAILI